MRQQAVPQGVKRIEAAFELAGDDDASQRQENARQAARKAARRARLSSAVRDRRMVNAPTNVLVYDQNDPTREHICELLEGFGFCTYPVSDVAQARFMADSQPFAAAFLDIRFDDADLGDSLDLCHRIKIAASMNGAECALILLYSTENPADRVRVLLVGGDATLAKPPGRGDIARALEDCRVALPSDARRY
jgi:CheY-like chemotaxis protein